jgi:hypothetical protein
MRTESMSQRPIGDLALLLATVLLPAALLPAAPVDAQVRSYQEVVPASAESAPGLFHVHRVEDRLLFEIPDSVLGRDMLIMSRYDKTQDGLADVGAMMSPNVMVRWEQRDDRILLRGVSQSSTADPGDRAHLAVENSLFPSVMASLPVQARGSDTSVVDVTDL